MRGSRWWGAGLCALGLAAVSLSASVRPQFIFTNPPLPAPALPSGPIPADGAVGVPTFQSLAWTFGTNTTNGDVRFGSCTQDPLPTVATLVTLPTYAPVLTASTTYCWQIVDRNGSGFNTGPVWRFTTQGSSGGTNAVLSTAELVPIGVFSSPNSGASAASFQLPISGRYESDGKFHYFQVKGDGSIGEFTEPTLAPMSTAYASLPLATWDTWTGGGGTGSWGTPNWNDDCVQFGNTSDGRPLCNAAVFGLKYFPEFNAICETWSVLYGYGTQDTSKIAAFGCYALNDTTHTFGSLMGCWGLEGSTPVRTAGGLLRIPDAWAAANMPSSSMKYVSGFGMPMALGGGSNSHGLTLRAFSWPSTNSCPFVSYGTDYPFTITGTKLLQQYLPGDPSVGPDCYANVGCVPSGGVHDGTQAPQRPYAMVQNWTGYSSSTYTFSWNPWAGPSPLPAATHGWMSAYYTQWAVDWYDDTAFTFADGKHRYGIVAPYQTQSGWLRQTVLASPAPTYTATDPLGTIYPVVTVAVSSLDTHDGAQVNPGDNIWIQGCIPGTDAGCDTANNDHLDLAVVRSVNTTTKVITAVVTNLDDCTSCTHIPPVGGAVWEGALYPHGYPNAIRDVERLKICDPAAYLPVLADQTKADLVQCNDEIDASTLMPTFGCPSCTATISVPSLQVNARGVYLAPGGGGSYGAPVSVMADPANRKIRVAYSTAKTGTVVIVVWSVVPL